MAAIPLVSFREGLYALLPYRADAVLDLLDALSGNTQARSVVELCLNTPFRPGYGSVYTAIHDFFQAGSAATAGVERRGWEQTLVQLIAPYLPPPRQRPFWLVGLDVTSAPRPYARTLADRSCVHQPTFIAGNKPITIGHAYSALLLLPEKDSPQSPPWVVPLSMRRVTSQETGPAVGAQQLQAVLDDSTLPFAQPLCVAVADSAYSQVGFLGKTAPQEALVTITRVRGKRTFYRSVDPPPGGVRPAHHPTWYGAPVKLSDPTTWGPADRTATVGWTTRRGRQLTVHLESWSNLRMHGTRQVPMHRYPFTLVRARVVDAQGEPVFAHPLWLLVMGTRRDAVSLVQVWEAYRQRFDAEHFFRFGKQRLLLTAYQTPDVEHEENWWQLVSLAYLQLWLASPLATVFPRPWERRPASLPATPASPSATQRDFPRLMSLLGTPAQPPKPRGYSPGRSPGQHPPARIRQPVVKKGRVHPLRA